MVAFIYFLQGATMLGCLVAALFFYRSWRRAEDKLLLYFSMAFLLLSLSQIGVVLFQQEGDFAPVAYFVRATAFLVILLAIVDKNRPPAE